jgi:hypothetical protein
VHAWQHLQHFFSWLFHSREAWGAIIGIIGALIGAIIGGRIAGRYALRAQEQAAKAQRQHALEAERRTIDATLRAIAAELQVLKDENFRTLQNALNERYETEEILREKSMSREYFPSAIVSSEQNYFTVFESNAAALGGINDEKLRENIIRTYGHAKGLIDLLNAHSREFDLWRNLKDGTYEKPRTADILKRFENTIRDGLNSIQCELEELLTKIEKYLDQ